MVLLLLLVVRVGGLSVLEVAVVDPHTGMGEHQGPHYLGEGAGGVLPQPVQVREAVV